MLYKSTDTDIQQKFKVHPLTNHSIVWYTGYRLRERRRTSQTPEGVAIMDARITALAERMSSETKARIEQRGTWPGYEKSARATVVPGRKYTKIDCGGSGRLMIDEDGHIFGIKGYGQVNKSRQYGTLDTIDKFYWGEYSPMKKEDHQ